MQWILIDFNLIRYLWDVHDGDGEAGHDVRGEVGTEVVGGEPFGDGHVLVQVEEAALVRQTVW